LTKIHLDIDESGWLFYENYHDAWSPEPKAFKSISEKDQQYAHLSVYTCTVHNTHATHVILCRHSTDNVCTTTISTM